MKVPAVSQLVNGSGGDRCGEASLAACLQALHRNVTMHDIITYLHKDYNDATSTLYDLINAAHHYGAGASILQTQTDMYAALTLPYECTIALLYNAFLEPLPYPHEASWYGNHFVVVESKDAKGIHVMDPLAFPGPNHCIVSEYSFIRAVHAVPVIPWGISVSNPFTSKTVHPTGPK